MNRGERVKEARRQRISQIIIGLIMVGIMVSSMLGYAYSNQGGSAQQELTYGEYEFTLSEQGFTTEIDGAERLFHHLPVWDNESSFTYQDVFRNVVEVNVDSSALSLLDAATYIGTTFDAATPSPGIQAIELARFDIQRSISNSFPALIAPHELYPGLSILDCANATTDVAIMKFRYSNETTFGRANITREDNCILVDGDVLGILAAKDTILYHYYGVIGDESN